MTYRSVYNSAMEQSRQTQEISDKAVRHVLAYAGIWFAVIAWGASFVAARVLLHAASTKQASLSPTVLAALRFSIASLFFVLPLGIAIVRR